MSRYCAHPSDVIHARYVGRPTGAGEDFQLLRTAFNGAQTAAGEQFNVARRRCAQLVKELKQRAWRTGYAQGQKAATEETIHKIVEREKLYKAAMQEAAHECLELALNVAQEVVVASIETNHDALAQKISGVIGNLTSRRAMRILVNPEQLDALRAALLLRTPEQVSSVVANASICPGNARIETIAGSIELDWSEHLETMRRTLHEALAGCSEGG